MSATARKKTTIPLKYKLYKNTIRLLAKWHSGSWGQRGRIGKKNSRIGKKQSPIEACVKILPKR